MTDVLHRPAMIAATVLAILTVTAMLWVGLRLASESASSQQGATLTRPVPAHLLPAHPQPRAVPLPGLQLLPVHWPDPVIHARMMPVIVPLHGQRSAVHKPR